MPVIGSPVGLPSRSRAQRGRPGATGAAGVTGSTGALPDRAAFERSERVVPAIRGRDRSDRCHRTGGGYRSHRGGREPRDQQELPELPELGAQARTTGGRWGAHTGRNRPIGRRVWRPTGATGPLESAGIDEDLLSRGTTWYRRALQAPPGQRSKRSYRAGADLAGSDRSQRRTGATGRPVAQARRGQPEQTARTGYQPAFQAHRSERGKWSYGISRRRRSDRTSRTSRSPDRLARPECQGQMERPGQSGRREQPVRRDL